MDASHHSEISTSASTYSNRLPHARRDGGDAVGFFSKSRMREIRTYGSVVGLRGASSGAYPAVSPGSLIFLISYLHSNAAKEFDNCSNDSRRAEGL